MLSCVSIICCSLLIVGTSYTGPPAPPPSPPVVFFVFLLITKHTMILVIISAVMSAVNKPTVIGTAIATVYRLNTINIININWPLTLPSVDCAVAIVQV